MVKKKNKLGLSCAKLSCSSWLQVGVGLSWAELSSVLSLGVGGVKVEIKAISAQPSWSWIELG